MRRHVFASGRPFDQVLAGIFGGISQPDIAQLFSKLEASGTYQQFSSLVEQAQGSAGLMRFWQLDLDNALTLDPEAPDWTGRRLVRLIAGNPVTMGQMTRHVADAGSYAPVTILIEETPDGGTRVACDSAVSALAPYDNAAASTVAGRLDAEVLGLLLDQVGYDLRLRDIDGVAGGDLADRGAGPVGQGPPGGRRDHPVFGGDEVPAGLGPPGRLADLAAQGVDAPRDLRVGQELGVGRREVAGEGAVEFPPGAGLSGAACYARLGVSALGASHTAMLASAARVRDPGSWTGSPPPRWWS